MQAELNHLTDNPNVPVYHFQKFIPKEYNLKSVDVINATSNQEYQGCFFFHRIKDERVAQLNVFKNAVELRLYHVDPFPHGFYQNIDWNDSTFLEFTKRAGKASVLELCKLLQELGYEYKSCKGFEKSA